MSKTASLVMKIIGASLAFAAVVCLLIGGWHDLSVGYCGMKKRLTLCANRCVLNFFFLCWSYLPSRASIFRVCKISCPLRAAIETDPRKCIMPAAVAASVFFFAHSLFPSSTAISRSSSM